MTWLVGFIAIVDDFVGLALLPEGVRQIVRTRISAARHYSNVIAALLFLATLFLVFVLLNRSYQCRSESCEKWAERVMPGRQTRTRKKRPQLRTGQVRPMDCGPSGPL